MNYKNITISITTFSLLFLVSIFVVSPADAYAQNLVVDFQEDPLFSEANFLPGNEVLRTVGVENNSDSTQDIIVEAINVVDDDNFGDVLDLVIKEGGTPIYEGTLGNFLSAGEVPLSSIESSSSTTYSFGVTFNSGANNDTQTNVLGFDLCIGFEGGDTNCGNTVIGGGGSGGGGGGGSIGGSSSGRRRTTLEVFNEEVTEENTGTETAVIEWDSNLLSTSQVIYGKESGGPYSLDLTVSPYFGYPLGTVEIPIKVTHHTVLLTGLEIGETYVYRVVSRSSPPTVGFEYTFILAEGGETEEFSTQTILETEEILGSSVQTTDNQEDSTENFLADDTQAAALGLLTLPDDLSGWLECLGFFLIFLVLIYIAWTLWRNRNSNYAEDKLSERRNLFFFIGSLLSIFIAYLLGWVCTILPLIVLAVISLALYLWNLFANWDR